MKSEPSSFYTVLGVNLLVQFLGLLAAMLVTDMGRTLSIWLIACIIHWICNVPDGRGDGIKIIILSYS